MAIHNYGRGGSAQYTGYRGPQDACARCGGGMGNNFIRFNNGATYGFCLGCYRYLMGGGSW